MPRPLCFVLMPFGRKPDGSGRMIDFNALHAEVIAPAIDDAGLEPLRADQELTGGIIHKAMFERLILCPFAVADLTGANANVFYELGVRHAARPCSTVLMHRDGDRLPFDVGLDRSQPYAVTKGGRPKDGATVRAALTRTLDAAKSAVADSPVYQLLDGMTQPVIDHTRTDVFRQQVAYAAGVKARLAEARRQGTQAAVDAVRAGLGRIDHAEAGVVVDLLLSYRAVKAWDAMIALAAVMAEPLARTALVREQLGFALNRAGRGAEAEQVLTDLIRERGASSETCGLLGRVYKDRWERAATAGDATLAAALLDRAIDAYLTGFEADFRDAYPGVNAVTLMEVREPPDPRRRTLLPVVTYAVERKAAAGEPDYWDHATLLELAVLGRDRAAADGHLGRALAAVREPWEPETTARNLSLIRTARERRGEADDWARAIEDRLGA